MYGYAYRWMKPEVYLEVPDQNSLEKADPIQRQLLGGYRDIDTQPWALERWARRHNVQRVRAVDGNDLIASLHSLAYLC